MQRLFYLLILVTLISCSNSNTVRFAVCTDVHQDLIHDAKSRLEYFIQEAEDNKVDFIIQLGDFCLPFEANEPFLKVWDSFDGEKYHVLGNHDMDVSPKVFIEDFLGIEKSYYSFDVNDFHFIVLDANYYKEGDKLVPYSNGNYYNHSENRCYIPGSQIEWLKQDLAQTEKNTIVFSHQSLEHWGGVKNRMEIRKVFKEANSNSKKVIACFCGHDHQDRYAEIGGIHYIGLNSLSYAWVGSKLEYSGRFPKKVEEKYKNLKYTLPYSDPVFATVEISSKGKLEIVGTGTNFIKPGPEELGATDHHYTAKISSRVLEF